MNTEQKPSLETENALLRAEVDRLKFQRVHAEHVAFCESLPGVWPAWRDAAIATLDHFALLPVPVEFGEGDSKAPLLDGFKGILAKFRPPVEFGEWATKERAALGNVAEAQFLAPAGCEVDPAAMEMHQKAVQYQKANGGTYEDAVRAVA